MTKKTTSLLLGLLLTGGGLSATAQQLAFPGAQGFGRFATGGRGGEVYHVTNLNDSGTGSLRDAISKPNRIIVFDVSGVINISSRLVFKNNLTIAGQTAPGEGITVYGNGVSFSGASNIIVRHMRFRMGKQGDSGKDCAGIANGTDMIFDHCSFSWGLDETFSINPDGKGTAPQNITISNTIMGQGLLQHSAGGLMQADNITLYRNLYCDNSTRNNKVKGIQQYVNNIVYNWKNGCYLMGGDSQGQSYVNVTNNLFINGPSGGGNAITSGNADFHIYATDNWQDRNRNGVLDPYEIPRDEYSGGPTFEEEPFAYPELDTWQASELVDKLLPTVGATLPYRDRVDFYMVHQVMSFGTEGAILSTEEQLPYGVPSSWTLKSFEKPADSDNDGMPDAWEEANGTDSQKDDAMTIAANGYANIENYINSLSTENRPFYLREPMLVEAASTDVTSITIGWGDYTEGEDGFIVEQQDGEAWKEVARTEADAQQCVVSGLTAGSAYTFRVCAFKGEEKSDYVTLEAKTKPESVEMVDCETFVGDENNWLIAPEQDEVITLDESVEKQAVVVRTEADVTITGQGSLDGAASLNKTRSGKLTVETLNGYTGQTVLHDGEFAFNTLKDGGEKSAIGASFEYAQNWIWDGGAWDYTGPSTSTNRSATMYKDTEFRVAKGSTVAMSGGIEGEANLILGGGGTVEPASQNFFMYDGNTILKDSVTLNLTYGKQIADKQVFLDEADAAQKLVLAGGNFKVEGGGGLELAYRFPIEVQEGTYSTFEINKNATIKSDVTGTGTLEYRIPYVREYLEGDWTKFYGTLVANGIGTEKDGSQLMFQKGFKGMPNTRVYLKGNTRMALWATNDEQYIGGVSGDKGTYMGASSKNTTNAKMIWHVGGANFDETFNGTIDNKTSANKEGNTSIVKEGSGAWRLGGNNVYKGTTTVNGGSLIVNGKHTGGGNYTVNDGATLAGEGSIASAVTLNEGAIIQGGDTVVDRNLGLTLTKALKVGKGAIVNVQANRAESNTIYADGAITLGEGAILQVNGGTIDEAPYDKTEYHVFTSSALNITGTFAEIQPATPGEGQEWDTTDLYTEGILRVVGGETNPNPDEGGEENPDVEEYRKWDFTAWSTTTQTNLEAEASKYVSEPWPAAGTETGWRRYEKDGGATDSEPLRAPNTIYWYGSKITSPTELKANGVAIEETKGLLFNNVTALNNTFAIAIDYPETSIGTYAGGSYLWLNGSDLQFTIPTVQPGQKILMEVESHKNTEGRGVKLSVDGEEIGSCEPKGKTTYEWTVPMNLGSKPVDVLVTSTKGCHIYLIEVGNADLVSTGIASFEADGGLLKSNVYTTGGVLVRKAGQPLDGLDKGVYIVDGEKVVVK